MCVPNHKGFQWSPGYETKTLGHQKKHPVDWAKLTVFCVVRYDQKCLIYTNAILAISLPVKMNASEGMI